MQRASVQYLQNWYARIDRKQLPGYWGLLRPSQTISSGAFIPLKEK